MTYTESDEPEEVVALKNVLKTFYDSFGFLPNFQQFKGYVVKEAQVTPEFVEEVTAKAGGYDSVLSQVFQPKGGSENFTNLRSPGQPPAKIPASGRSPDSASNTPSHQLNTERYQAYDSSGTYSQADPNVSAPQGRKVSPTTFVGRTERHPGVGRSGADLSGEGYQPSIMEKYLAVWKAQRHTDAGTNPGTPLPSRTVQPGEDIPETEGETVDEGDYESERALREQSKPKLVLRDMRGVGRRDIRVKRHPTYQGP